MMYDQKNELIQHILKLQEWVKLDENWRCLSLRVPKTHSYIYYHIVLGVLIQNLKLINQI
jgi:hypothetical protein